MDKDNLVLIALIYLLIGILVLIFDRKKVHENFNWVEDRTPFWNGFYFGFYQWSIIVLFPIWLYQRLSK